MENGSNAPLSESNPVREAMRSGRTSAEEIIAGQRRRDLGPHGRRPGTRPGYYRVVCLWCRGFGLWRVGLAPFERCLHCDGSGILEIMGERKTDAGRWRPRIVPRPVLYAGISLLVVAVIVAIAMVMH